METQILTSHTVNGEDNSFTGGLLRIGESVAGWTVVCKMNTMSGEADLYIVQKEKQKGVVKYYRSTLKPKTDILEKLVKLDHPDIVRTYGFGTYKNRFYEIMEYAAGGSVDSRDEQGKYRYLPLSEDKGIQLVKEVINSYKTCHSLGIIHRDIKPANIYYRNADGSDVVIGDFGISSIMQQNESEHKTQTASRTTGYAAPEVLSGIISPAMDYYALGITLWEVLTGKDPFVLANGKRRNDAHLIRDTIEGRIADDLLSREPKLDEKVQHLIRGLLVIDPAKRWGYSQVSAYLAGEEVPVYVPSKNAWKFSIGNIDCTSLEELGIAIINKPDVAQKYIYRGLLQSFLEDIDRTIADKINRIVEETSASKEYYNGILQTAFLLNPAIPLDVGNGFKINTMEDIRFLIEKAPETMEPLINDTHSKIYTYMKMLGYEEYASEINSMVEDEKKKNREVYSGNDAFYKIKVLAKADVILNEKCICPFNMDKYKSVKLSSLEQLPALPARLSGYLAMLVKENSYEGNFIPWLELMSGNTYSAVVEGLKKRGNNE